MGSLIFSQVMFIVSLIDFYVKCLLKLRIIVLCSISLIQCSGSELKHLHGVPSGRLVTSGFTIDPFVRHCYTAAEL